MKTSSALVVLRALGFNGFFISDGNRLLPDVCHYFYQSCTCEKGFWGLVCVRGIEDHVEDVFVPHVAVSDKNLSRFTATMRTDGSAIIELP